MRWSCQAPRIPWKPSPRVSRRPMTPVHGIRFVPADAEPGVAVLVIGGRRQRAHRPVTLVAGAAKPGEDNPVWRLRPENARRAARRIGPFWAAARRRLSGRQNRTGSCLAGPVAKAEMFPSLAAAGASSPQNQKRQARPGRCQPRSDHDRRARGQENRWG
jgi:hypothetical protein